MTHIPLKTALTAALAAAEEGAAVVRHYATEARSRLVLHDKGTFELVSEADVEVQRVLVRHLDGVIPGARFLGEEEGLGEAEDRSGWWWILDPIDGTTNFLHGVPPYAISIGLVGDGVPVLGVVHDVPHHEVFAGYEGGGRNLQWGARNVQCNARLRACPHRHGFPVQDLRLRRCLLGRDARLLWQDARDSPPRRGVCRPRLGCRRTL